MNSPEFQIFAEANRILTTELEGLCEAQNQALNPSSPPLHGFSLQPPAMADIAEVTLSDKSDKEEEC